jgi:hypothetical protein
MTSTHTLSTKGRSSYPVNAVFLEAQSSTCAATTYTAQAACTARGERLLEDTLLGVIYIGEVGCRVFEPDGPRLVFIQVFAGNVVLWHLVRADSLLIGGVSSFHAGHHVGLERVSFLDQFVDALRVRALDVR